MSEALWHKVAEEDLSPKHKFFDTHTKEEFYVSDNEYKKCLEEMECEKTRLNRLYGSSAVLINVPFILNGHEQWIYKTDENYDDLKE